MRTGRRFAGSILHFTLAVCSVSICAVSAPPALAPLRVVFAPHPFLSHWAVSAPIAQELLHRGHRVLVSMHSLDYFMVSEPNLSSIPRSWLHLTQCARAVCSFH